jgi:tetratricopeptide (TPR) repeat protein
MQNAPSKNAPCPCGSGRKYKRCCGQGGNAGAPAAASGDRLQQAIRHYQQGNYQAASQITEQLLKRHPEDTGLLEISAASALQLGNSGLAADRFRQQIRLQPDNALAHSNLCMALHNLGRDEEAFVYGQKAISLEPGLADAWNNLGNLYKSGNHLQGALEHYEKSLALDSSDPRVHVNAGSTSQLLGDLETARKRYQDALKIFPGFAAAHNNLGVVYHKLGQHDAARRHFSQALKLQPDNPETLTNMSMLWLDQGEFDKAQACLEKVTRDYPAYTGALINLGYLHDRRNDSATANRYYDKVLAHDPGNSTVHCNIGYSLFELGHQKEALEHFVRALKTDPNSAKALAGLGKAMLRQDDLDKAAEYIEKALRLSPWDVHAHIARAQFAAESRDHATALQEWNQVIELQPGMSEGYVGLARLYADLNRYDDARTAFQQAEAAGARTMGLYHAWSGIEEKNNHLDEAERRAAEAAGLDPDYPGLTILRAKLARRRNNLEEALALLDGIDKHEIRSREMQATFLFELGAVYDKLGRFPEAFAAYDEANQVKNEYIGKTYSPEQDAAKFTRWRAFFTPENWQRLRGIPAPRGDAGPCPVFIVGFPRSGTSLLEQILGSHPQIAPAGELTGIHELAAAKGHEITASELAYPHFLLDPDTPLTAEKLAAMRAFYLDGLRKAGAAEAGSHWITDKMPHNALHLGLISLLFPQSPIIHIVRHPFNSCLSAYFSNFKSTHRYTSSLEGTAIHYKYVMEMLNHYRDTLATGFLEIHYEDLVEDQEATTRRILDYIGAPWDPACLQHHKSKRLVKTASYEQVTRKVYRSSLYRYRNYRDAVQPLIPILQSTLQQFGYSAD